ncbi:MAG: hypothetical protein AAB391_01265 [Patescibacteria group bacterium]
MKKAINALVIFGLSTGILGGFAQMAQAQVLAPNYDPRPFGSTLEVHVNDNGSVSIQGARVEQVSGTTLFCKVYWGVSFIRVTVRTSDKTAFEKRFGQAITVKEISVGDFISVTGDLFEGSNSLDVVAKKVKNWSLQTLEEGFSGSISELGTSTPTALAYILNSKTRGKITLLVASSTPVNKGTLVLSTNTLGVGTKITSATGVYNNLKKTLEAQTIRIYQDMSIFKPRNFEGVIKSIDGNTLPLNMVVTVGGVDYTLPLADGVSILNNKRQVFSIARFIKGDKVRFYGAIREAQPNIVDATVLRNLSL